MIYVLVRIFFVYDFLNLLVIYSRVAKSFDIRRTIALIFSQVKVLYNLLKEPSLYWAIKFL